MNEGDTWALVTDGIRARILRGLARDGLAPPGELVSLSRSAHLRARLAGRPETGDHGQVIDLASAMPLANLKAIRNDMIDFLRETLRLLDQHRLAGDFDRLAVFAPAAVLEICREQAPTRLARIIALASPVYLVATNEQALRLAVTRALACVSASSATGQSLASRHLVSALH